MRKRTLRKEKEEKKEKKSKRHRGPHHIIPTSRQGDNIYPNELWDPESEMHTYWHELFANMLPEEVVELLREYTNSEGVLKDEFFNTSFTVTNPFDRGKDAGIKGHKHKNKISKRQHAWGVVFPHMNVYEAIEWIEREFIRKEWLETPQ